jgi:translation initiation factor 1A
MPRNKVGGSKAKRGKNVVQEKKILESKEEGEHYAQITKVSGNGRFIAMCDDGVERIAILRGSMRKRMWVNRLDVVLIEPWEFEPSKCSILLKYDYEDFYKLKDIPKTFVLEEDQDAGLDDFNPFEINDSDEETDTLPDETDVKQTINIDEI